ncbi:prepilin peptidase [bacterium]|nr:prepilin peptidase [bacterium]
MLVLWFLSGVILSEYIQLISDRGSFLNSLWGRSKCDECQKEIPWVSLIPFIGRFLNGGRCVYCNKKISLKYFWFELLFSLGWAGILYGFWYLGVTSFWILAPTLLLYCATILLMYEDYKNYSVPVTWLISWLCFYALSWWSIGGRKMYLSDTLLMLGVLALSLLIVYFKRPKKNRSISSLFGTADILVLVQFALLLGFQKTTWVLVFSMIGAFFFLLWQKRLEVGQRLPLLTVMLLWGVIALWFL